VKIVESFKKSHCRIDYRLHTHIQIKRQYRFETAKEERKETGQMKKSLKCVIRVFSLSPDGFHREIWLERRRSTQAYPITRTQACYCDIWFLRTPKLRNEFAFYLVLLHSPTSFFFITTGLRAPPKLAAAHAPPGVRTTITI